MHKKTKDLLKQKELYLEDFSVELSVRQSSFNSSDEEHTYVNMSFYNHYESDEIIGTATFLLYDAKNNHISHIRYIADGYSFDMYQSLSSVRIYSSEEDAEFDQILGFVEDQYSNTPWLEIQNSVRDSGFYPFSYEKGFEQGTFEGLPYHSLTQSIWGKILVLNDISLKEEYRTNSIINVLFENILATFKKIGCEWIIINTNINEEYMKMKDYPFNNKEEFEKFLSKIGFIKTYGRLHNGEYCLCYNIQDK